jgi:hypothetical protein
MPAMQGLMQDPPLTIEMVLSRARRARTVATGDAVLSWAEVSPAPSVSARR